MDAVMRVPPELIATSAAKLANDADDLKAELTSLARD